MTAASNPAADLLGTVRRKPNGRVLAVLWPSNPHPARWIVTDQWGSAGYETDAVVADWPVVGAVPFSPAAGMSLSGDATPAAAPHAFEKEYQGESDAKRRLARCKHCGQDRKAPAHTTA